MKNITLLVFALLSALYCPAHYLLNFTMPVDSTISKKSFCKNLRVIDMRKNKGEVGAMSFRTIDKMEGKLTTEQPLPDILSSYFDKISYNNKGEYELLLVLHDFWIMKKLNDMDFGHFFFSGDFYIGKDGKYAILDSVDELYEMNLSKQYIGNIMRVAHRAMFQLLNTYATLPIDNKTFTLSEQDAQNRRAGIRDQYAIYKENFKKGVYYTTEQFLSNTPGDTAIIVKEDYIDERRRLYYYYHKNEKGKAGKKIHVDEFFAIYDGKRWHAGGEHGTKKMLFENGEFIAMRSGYGIVLPYRRSDMQLIGMGGIAAGGSGGFIGGAIGSALGQIMASGITNKHNSSKKMIKAYYICRFDPGKKEYVAIEREIMY